MIFIPTLLSTKCPYCTDGIIEKLMNYSGFYHEGEEPIMEYDTCEECGGFGTVHSPSPFTEN